MKMRSAMVSQKTRFVVWTILGGTLAVAAASPWPVHSGQEKPGRKTTDPPVAARGKLGQELFLAIDHRDLAGVQALLKKGADPDSRNGLEFTPLYIAAAGHQADVMQALLSAGAKPDADSSYGTPLTFAAATGNAEGVKILLARGANVNATRTDGITVLMMAANAGSPEIVGELLKRKADVNTKDEAGSTALTLAARGGHAAVVRILLDAGAAVDGKDGEGQTPLMAAAVNGHGDCVQILIEKGANPNARDGKGRTALILAAAYGDDVKVVSELLAHRADKKPVDSYGCTAAALAGARGHRNIAKLLGEPSPVALAAAGASRSPSDAVRVSLKALQASTREFCRLTNCVSCHQEGLGRMATGEARAHGFGLDEAVLRAQTARVNGMLGAMQPLHEQALKSPEVMKQIPLIEINEVGTTYTWLLAGMAANDQPPNASTAAMAMVLARQQAPDGHWSFSIPRVPMQSSNVTFTALAVRALEVYGPKSRAVETAEQVQRAKAWLVSAPTQDSEDRASRLLGLYWAGARDLRKATAAVRADQQPDGGWSQLPNLPSDAYATGQALYALHVGGGIPVTDSAYQRGVKYLLRTQDPDGSWFVSKRATPANNYFDAGFPHGESQYASYNGTCWAVMALLETIPRRQG